MPPFNQLRARLLSRLLHTRPTRLLYTPKINGDQQRIATILSLPHILAMALPSLVQGILDIQAPLQSIMAPQ